MRRGHGWRPARTRAALAAALGALVLPAPAHADQWVDLYEWGVFPTVLEVEAGETVHFTNWSGLPTAIASENGVFDSGALGPGAGYSVRMTVPGSHAYATAGVPDVDARIDVFLREITGPPDDLVADHLPDLPFPALEEDDIGVHPEFGIEVSRTRILLGFVEGTTVAEANDDLADANVSIRGVIPELGLLLVTPDPADEDAFATLDNAIDNLRDDDAVEFAALDEVVGADVVPAYAEAATATSGWTWDSPFTGANWGLEASRFPQAWNLLEAVKRRNNDIGTGVVDMGFQAHVDLPSLTIESPSAPADSHGNHVSGIIGAAYDNASAGRSFGVSGTNPVARMYGSALDSFTGASTAMQAMNFLLDGGGSVSNLRAINFSVGASRFSTQTVSFGGGPPPPSFTWVDWWSSHLVDNCGPGNGDDGVAGSGWCTPDTDDVWLEQRANAGMAARRVAERASDRNVVIVQSAGNAGARFCLPPLGTPLWTNAAPTSAQPTALLPCTAPAVLTPVRSWNTGPFAWASLPANWTSAGANPIIVVENINSSLARSASSNIGGDISAPGNQILSTVLGNAYGFDSGTSMAAPHVTGLIGYLLAYDPTLSVSDVRDVLTRWAVHDTSGGATSRIDAYAALMALSGSTKAMVDVNDPSPDGNRRQIPQGPDDTGAPELDTVRGTGFYLTAPDDFVDMRDFRRYRDAWLQNCLQPPDALSQVGCPAGDINLDGGGLHPKFDLNFDGCVYWISLLGGVDPNNCVTPETTYPRFDFNGDGWIARSLTSEVPQPLPVEGSVATTHAELTDLQVLTSVWEPDPDNDEGWESDALEGLLVSGELHVHGERFFAAGADSVELGFRNPATGQEYPSRTLERGDETFLHTVPAGTPIEITGSAVANGEPIQSTQVVAPLDAGEDRRLDLCLLDFDLSSNRSTVLAGSTVGIEIVGTLAGCEGDDVASKAVTFTLEPANENGATLSAEHALTGPDGRARTTFHAGDVVHGYTIKASVLLGGDDRRLEDELQIQVVPALKVAYAWRQEILEWSESGSSRWGPPIDPLLPDCVAAGVGYCIDTFTLTPAAPFNALEREGVISGLGNELTLTEEVASSPNSSRQSWAVTDPDGSNPRSDETVVQWQVADDQLSRYTDHELPDTVRTRDDAAGIRLFGLRAIAGLGYQHDASFVEQPDVTMPVELWFTTGRMLLQPRGDGSSLQYAPKTTVPILFPRQPDGRFGSYTYCQTIEYDLTTERGYWDPTGSEWVRGATTQNRKTTFLPGDKPMPVGPGRIRVRYAFGAVAAYGSEDPVAVAPACETTGPPVASFIYGPEAVDEGRLVAFTSTSTDPENDIVAWEWNFGDGTVESGIPNTFGLTGHLFKDDGVFEVSLTVTDSEGHSSTTSKTIVVSNLPPEANIEATTGVAGQAIDVPYSVWDPSSEDSRALEVEITLAGQATPLLSTTREAGFSTFRVSGLGEGAHTLTLRVEDDDGAVTTDTAVVTVLPEGEELPDPPPPPPPTPTCDPGVVLDAEEQAFTGLLNLYRAQNGLQPVTASPTLTRAAERHANDMATNDHFSHTGTDDSTPFERAQDAGYPGETVSENLFFGSPRAQDALLSWKSSLTGHNENMLGQDWHAIGIARQFGSGKWFWATSFGDLLDCPGGEGAPAAVAAATTAPKLAPAASVESGESAPVRSLFTAAFEQEPAAAAVLLPYDPLAAFTISNVQPRENQPLTVVNRSRDAAGTPIAATLEYGDGQVVELAPDASVVIRLPGESQELVLRATDAGGRDSRIERQLWVEPLRPPSIQYLGETFGAVGKPLPVSARVRSPWDNTPLAGVAVTFAVGPASVTAMTGSDGLATATLVLNGVTAGSQFLTLTTPATDDLAAGTTSAFVTVVDNHPPVAKPGGPYVAGEGGTLLLDGGLSTDPDPGDAFGLTYAWDYDGDGAFDDATGATPPELSWEEIRLGICGGLCATGTPYPIGLEATDRWGDTHSATTTVTFTADFGIVLGGGTITIVPGASNSVAVHVIGSSGWTEPVTLSITGLPAGVTATFSKNPVTPTDTSVLTLTAGPTVENGTFPVRVSGTGGGITHETGEDVSVAFGLIPICFGTFTGTVENVETHLPVQGVVIRLFNVSGAAATDENGRYVFRNVPLGFNNAPRLHNVRTEHSSYWEKSTNAQAVCRGTTRVDFEVLAKKTGRLSGLVVDRDTRLPLNGARLSAFDGPTGFAGADGRYALDLPLHPNNQPRFYTYSADATGYWPQSQSVTVDPATPQVRDYELLRKCQGTIRGGVVRVQQTNALVANSVVRLSLGGFQTVSVFTNAQGEYSFNRLVDLGPENTQIGYSVQAFPPSGSPTGSQSGFATFVLEACGGEAFTDIFIRIPVENFGAIDGTVRDEETLEPIAGANLRTCTLTCLETQSKADGTYSFPKLHVGFDSQVTRSFSVQGSKTGYYTANTLAQTVTAGETTTFDVVLLRQRFGRLEGTVTDLLSGAPIPGAGIQSPPFGCSFDVICAITNRDGFYADAVPLGTRNAPFSRSFTVSATGYWPQTRLGNFTADTTTVVDVQLLKECEAAQVVGIVVNAETQAPILGATVSGGGRSTNTDAAGRFALTGLKAGNNNAPLGISITASASGFFSQTKSITIFCGATIVVDFGSRETALGIIAGTVTNADASAPIAGVLVGTEFGATATTDAAGNFLFTGVPLGDLNSDRAWKISAFPSGFKPQTKTVVAKANVEVRADFAFTALGNARPIADAANVAVDEDQLTSFVLTASDADGDPLTYHVMRFPAHGTLFGNAPNLQYRADPNYHGPDSLEFLVNDGLDNSVRATITIDVAPTNDPPQGVEDFLETGMNVPLEIPFSALTANDKDIDGDALTITNVFSFGLADVELRESSILFTPPEGYSNETPSFFFLYILADGSGATSSASVFIRVTEHPLAPVCADVSFAATVDTPLAGSVACTDGNGDALTYELVSSPADGLLALAPDGTFTFTPPPGFVGNATFTFRATDGTLTSANATATITVEPENGPPVAGDVEVSTDEDTAVPIVLVATDPDGDTLTLTHGDPSHGTFDGTTYTPAANFHGTDSFTYTADDGLETDEGTVTITVRPVADAPTAGADSVSTDEDTPATGNVLANDVDVDGDTLTAALEEGPAHGSATVAANGSFEYVPDADFAGPDEFTYRVSDGALSTLATVHVEVRPVEDAPAAADDAFSTDEDTAVSGTVLANDHDPEGGPLTATTLDGPDHGTLSLGSNGMFTYTPSPNFNGSDSFTYTATDPAGRPATATARIEVDPVNDAPTAQAVAVATDEDVPLDLVVAGADVDGDSLTTEWTRPAHGTYDGSRYVPAANYNGPDEFTYTVRDPSGESATATVTIDVRPVNDAPVATDATVDTDEDVSVAIALAGSDVDADALSFRIDSGPAHGTYAGGVYTPAQNYHGPDAISFTADDGHGGIDTATVAITVRPVNDPPVAEDRSVTTNEDTPVAIALGASDADGDTLTFRVESAPAHGTYADGTYTPAANYNGPDSFTYVADDGNGGTDTATVEITVEAAPDGPTATDKTVTTDEDTAVAIALGGTDDDGDTLVAALATPPSHGTYVAGTYTPAPNYHGPDSFTFTVSDGSQTDTGTVSITVRPVNDHPVAEDKSVTTTEDTPVAIAIAGTDVDGDGLTFTWEQPAHGSFDGTTYVPAAGFFGSDSFVYTASDGKGGSATATVSITVEPANRPPVVELTGPAVVDEGAAPATFAAAASDPDGDTLEYTWTGATGAGASATFAADDGPSTHTITVTVDDGVETASASRIVTVRNVAPAVDAGPPLTGVWGLPVVFAGSATDPSSADTAAGFSGGWLFGDGAGAPGLSATHAFADPGPFLAVLTARDKDGGQGSDTTTVTVGKRPTSLAYTGSSSAPPTSCGAEDGLVQRLRWINSVDGSAQECAPATSHPYGAVTLSARLADLAHPATARLAGRPVHFRLGVLSFAATTNAAGEAVARPALPIPPGTYEVVVTFAGDTHYLPSEARAPLTVASTDGKITGGGLRSRDHPGRGGFNVHGSTKGELQWQNGTLNFHAPEITALGVAPDRRSAWFAGTGRDGRTYVAYVEDNGEPGRTDIFKLWVAGALQTPGDGRLSGGNIQIHR